MFNIKVTCNFWVIWIIIVAQTGYAVFDDDEKVECKSRMYDDSKLCHENSIKFYLRTKVEPNYELLKTSEKNTITQAPFIEDQPIKFIIHGHRQNPSDDTMTPLPSEYLKLNYNVILIDYSKLSQDPCYRTAVRNSKRIAKCSTELLEEIVADIGYIELERFHIIGLSLGGQIAGQMKHFLKEGKFSRITGIDPANEGFFDRLEEDDYILTKGDADYVDVIHTNAGITGKFRLMGHADFYANSGIFQPECPRGIDEKSTLASFLCAHFRSLILFLESIGKEDTTVTADQCETLDDWFVSKCETLKDPIPFGEQASKEKAQGIFFFKTKYNTHPYLRDHDDESYTKPLYKLYAFHLNPIAAMEAANAA